VNQSLTTDDTDYTDFKKLILECHPERSEGSLLISAEILRFTQNDKQTSYIRDLRVIRGY
jgi:hypothetical protein